MNRILLIEPDPVMRAAASQALAGLTAKVEAATDPESALERIRQDKVHVVLLDLDQEGIDGPGLVQEIREIDPLIQLIVTARDPRLSSILHALELGANDYVPLPLRNDGHLHNVVQLSFDKLERWCEAMRDTFGK